MEPPFAASSSKFSRQAALLLWLVACLLASTSSAAAALRLPALFSDHMVLQQEQTIPVWGWDDPGAKVTVTLSGGSQSATATAGADGRWQAALPTLPARSVHTLTVQGTDKTITIQDVLIGEVWLCAGQSNMVMTVAASKDAELESAAANLPQLRMFTVGVHRPETVQQDCQGAWIVCSPETVGAWSAVAFHFGRDLHRRLDRPVGLILAAAGGTLIESWLSLESQQGTPALQDFFAQRARFMAAFDRTAAAATHQQNLVKWQSAVAAAKLAGAAPPARPSDPLSSHLGIVNVGGLFNGMIAPLAPFAIRGIIWYQGESNAHPDRAPYYETQLRLLVQDWRRLWGAQLPIAWVQLPNLQKKMPWPEIREAQLKCLDLPKTGMAVTIDVGESKDIHPKDKQPVGQRLAWWALGEVYDEKVPATSGPLLASHEVRGSEIILRFRHTSGGIQARGGQPLQGFLIAGPDRAWKPAQARIEGPEIIIVSSPQVPRPLAVRYAWAPDPICNLISTAGLPASPFRTDTWPTLPAKP